MDEMIATQTPTLAEEIRTLVNRRSLENRSNTPDYILAEYILDCLDVFSKTVNRRDSWYGFQPRVETKLGD